jgi:hypothetical protein
VFGYPLQPKHLGTCEQAVGEAMLVGAVPVVLDNPAEKHIVQDNVTGLIAKSTREYSSCIKLLYDNQDLKTRLSQNAKEFAFEKYSMRKKIREWGVIFDEVLKENKTAKRWKSSYFNPKYSGSETFIESLGDQGYVFWAYTNAKASERKEFYKRKIVDIFNSNTQWHSNNKGGVRQYLKYFPDDIFLKEWELLLA